jgi:cell division protein ZapA
VSASTKVEIYDQTYQIGGGLDPDYVEELARNVDAKMREVARATGTVDSVKVAVLAALALADELHGLRQIHDEGRSALKQQARRCLKLVERAIQQTS